LFFVSVELFMLHLVLYFIFLNKRYQLIRRWNKKKRIHIVPKKKYYFRTDEIWSLKILFIFKTKTATMEQAILTMAYFSSFCEKVRIFLKHVISKEKRPFELKFSGYYNGYEICYWMKFHAKIPCCGFSRNILL
jgi:hypothetical protein